ncbi:hypothetical protein H6G04_30870 [Calothrix membranacea FACHB-236]|nr:hypothetical protein [Calothrix membranacea FACHB-236]
MSMIFFKWASALITAATVAVIGSTLPVSAETTFIIEETPSQTPQTTSVNQSEEVAQIIQPGRATRSGSSYVGIGGNIGLTGDTRVGEGSFAVISKIGLTQNLSVRPAALVGDNTVFLVPLTVDFAQRGLEITQASIAPYIGGGVAISTGQDSTVGALISGGVDVPLSPEVTATGGVNVSFIDATDVGLFVGVGYNF